MSPIPKLNKKMAQATKEAESSHNTELVPEGMYDVTLTSVETKMGKDSKQPYWLWTFDVPEDAEEHAGKRFWLNTSLQESALWKLNEVFEAFGVDPDTDTDTLVGEMVKVAVSQRPIGAGPKQGQITNQVENVFAADAEEGEDGDDSGDDSGDDAPPDF